MAKSINPFPSSPTVPITSGTTSGSNVRGVAPLAMGKVAKDLGQRQSLTEIERTTLEAIGWDDSIEIPKNMAEILYQATEALKASPDLLPHDPRRPAVKVNTVDLNTLPETEKKKILAAMAQAIADQKAADEALVAEAHREEMSMKSAGMGNALLAVDAAIAAGDAKAAETAPPLTITGDPKPAAAPEPATTSESGAAPLLTHCPHCEKELSKPPIAEPPYADKMSFLASMLGGTTFTKAYDLMGGNVRLSFRTLTIPEIDIVFRQAHLDRVAGKFSEDVDFYEVANRYRMYLQISAYHTGIGVKSTAEDLPDGYSLKLNPNATGVWVQPEKEATLGLTETGLPAVEAYLLAKVFKSESIFRIAHTTCKQFNRLVAKMDAMADNSDFWKPTEGPSS